MSWKVKQQVNFYSSEFRPPELAREIRQLIHYGIAGLAFAVVSLIAVLIAGVWSEHQLADTRAQVAVLNLEIEEVQRHMGPRTLDPQLEKQRTEAQASLLNSQRVLNYLSRQNIEKRISFTPLLRGLEQVAVDNVWLSGVSVFERGQHLQLRGYTDKAAQLSPYVTQLSAQEAYRQRGFRTIDIQQTEQTQQALSFVLDTRSQSAAALSAAGGH
tara:strand:- start:800 stop:1441 length:642 start_codon:yes stop_codon:yes gene_type:complete